MYFFYKYLFGMGLISHARIQKMYFFVSNPGFLFIREMVENRSNRYDLGLVQLNYQNMISFWLVHVHSYPLSFIFSDTQIRYQDPEGRNCVISSLSCTWSPATGQNIVFTSFWQCLYISLSDVHNSCC